MLALTIPLVAAHAADVDWKIYGAASVAGPEVCFYDSKGVVHMPDGNVQAWTKCLAQGDLDTVDVEHDYDGKIMINAARKILDG
jgi:hypothetical protein